MNNRNYALALGILMILTSALAGCLSQSEPLPLEEDEIGELSVIVTLDFGERGNETANLEDRLTNGSITLNQ